MWERRVKEARCGRVTDDSCSIRLHLRLRHYWSSLLADETQMERIFLCYRQADEIVAGRMPLSNEVAEQLCALYAQLYHGDVQTVGGTDAQLDTLLRRFFPRRLLDVMCVRSLRANVRAHWTQLVGVTEYVRARAKCRSQKNILLACL